MNEEDYRLCELENKNLRNALAWAAAKLTKADQDELEKRLDAALDDGGVTGTDREDERHALVKLLTQIVTHTEPLLLSPPSQSTKQQLWFQRLDYLLSEARQYEEKHPLMRRIGGQPNVFAPVRLK